eukprot:1930403-Amphidinium_carterae.2
MSMRTMRTVRTMKMTSRVTSTNYCSTSDNSLDYYYQLEDFVTTGEEGQYRVHYISFNDMNKI